MQGKPTHATITQFVASLLPTKPNDVQFLYHVPRSPKYDPNTALVEQIVLSVVPTSSVYSLIGYHSDQTTVGPDAAARTILPRPPRTICFLHRPFGLDRCNIRRGTLVLSSHTSFDEHLTVGWNIALATRLGMDTKESICLQGYKGDPERKIGIIGQVPEADSNKILVRIKQEFGSIEFLHRGPSEEIGVVAIMNAFHAEEVHRVFKLAQKRDWVDAPIPRAKSVLYLTGQPRESGLAAAKELGMTVVCIEHRKAEDWGVSYLTRSLRAAFHNVDVKEVYEELPMSK